MPVLANSKHEAVLQAYLASADRVGWRAYKSVYADCSQRAAETAWSRLLNVAAFAARFDELTAEVLERAITGAAMDLQEVLEELSKLGRSSIKKVIGVGGDVAGEVIASLEDLPDDVAAAIQEMTVDTYFAGKGDDAREVKRVKVKLHSKSAALAELLRHLVPQKHEHSFGDVAKRLTAALARTAEKPAPRRHDGKVGPDRDAARARGARKPARKGKPARPR